LTSEDHPTPNQQQLAAAWREKTMDRLGRLKLRRRMGALSAASVVMAASAVIAVVLVSPSSRSTRVLIPPLSDMTTTTTNATATTTKTVWYDSVGLTIPSSWPVIDGAHFAFGCSSAFDRQADRIFLGVSYQGAPSCGSRGAASAPPRADGVWMQPGGRNRPPGAPTTLRNGQVVYLSNVAPQSAVSVWYRNVSIEIGIGPDPAIERAIFDSITYKPNTADSPLEGRCPPTDPTPPTMPTPSRLTVPIVLPGDNGQMRPEPPNVQPTVSAASVWATLFQQVGAGGFAGPLQWNVYFGSYSAQNPANINPDGSSTPQYQGVPTWLIQGEAVNTAYGPCGITVLAPFNAATGDPMGIETIG